MNQEVFAALAEALERGEEVALVTIVSSTGSTPQRVGAKMLVFADGRTVGTIGGGCYENDAFWKAREAIRRRKPLTRQVRAQRRLRAGNRADLRRADGSLHRAGRAVARALRLRRRATSAFSSRGWRTMSASGCTSSTTAKSSPTPSGSRCRIEVVVDDIPTWLAQPHLPPHAYAVIVTRGHTQRSRRAAGAGAARRSAISD